MLSQALQVVLQGWPSEVEEETLKPYFIRKEELCVLAGFLLWGARVIVSPQGREEVLNILHDTHPGIVKMKSLARSYVWWPKKDKFRREGGKLCYLSVTKRLLPVCHYTTANGRAVLGREYT